MNKISKAGHPFSSISKEGKCTGILFACTEKFIVSSNKMITMKN